MITRSGEAVWPKGSKYYKGSSVPTLDDIAWGLARMVRFAGQTHDYYTVLLHTLTVADVIDEEYKLYALLHDAPESVVADVPSTWKTQAAKDREHELLELICRDYIEEHPNAELRWPWPDDAADALADADELCLAAEAHALGHSAAEEHWPLRRYRKRTGFYQAMKLTYERQPLALGFAAHPEKAIVQYLLAFPEKQRELASSH